ncbi:MAG: hypothetical protein QG657_4994 [Acidobacteriota bacterium]|nr:hypothetical protein [Acidobacteriota bacterium]
MISALVLPYFSKYIDKTNEKQQLVTVLTAVSDLRKNAISYMAVGEIDTVGHDLVLFLDNREIKRITLPEPPIINHVIYFNRYGMASGGEILVKFKRLYKIEIEEASGKMTVF